MLPVEKPWSNPKYAYLGPTRSQASRVAWQDLKDLTPRDWISDISESTLTIHTVFGSMLQVVGMDKPQRFEGTQWDGCVQDEASDQKPNTFSISIRPALAHRKGWCWRIGVPKRFGVGARDFKRFYDRGVRGEAGIESYTWPSSDILPADEINEMKSSLSEKDYNEQANASWESASGLCFYAFSKSNIDQSVIYDPNKPIIVGSDFNVNPMCWVLCQKQENGDLLVFDEIFIRNTNTAETLEHLWAKYGSRHNSTWHFIGDAASRQRRTSADSTDYLIIMNASKFRPYVNYPQSNPSIKSRIAACNAHIRLATGVERLRVHPRCVHLIEDLENRAFDEKGQPDDSHPDSGHMTDALGYVIHRLFPISYIDSDYSAEESISIEI